MWTGYFEVFIKCHSLCLLKIGDNYDDVIMSALASQITSRTIVYSTVYSGADQRKHQSTASLAFVWGIQRWLGTPHKGPATQKMFPFDDVIMYFRPLIVESLTIQDCSHTYTGSGVFRYTWRTFREVVNMIMIILHLYSANFNNGEK